jgi:hypothetical protein
MSRPAKHSLKGKIITVRRGVAVYQTHASPFYQARIWVPKEVDIFNLAKTAGTSVQQIERF